MSAPATEFLRVGQVVNWLRDEGISLKECNKLIAVGIIKRSPLRDGGRNYYFKSQIERDLFHRMNEVKANGQSNGKRAA